jgi:hypothetical protein
MTWSCADILKMDRSERCLFDRMLWARENGQNAKFEDNYNALSFSFAQYMMHRLKIGQIIIGLDISGCWLHFDILTFESDCYRDIAFSMSLLFPEKWWLENILRLAWNLFRLVYFRKPRQCERVLFFFPDSAATSPSFVDRKVSWNENVDNSQTQQIMDHWVDFRGIFSWKMVD